MRKLLILIIPLLIIPAVVVAGYIIGRNSYAFVSALVVLLGCVPFFLAFEDGNNSGRRVVTLAVMTALSVAGRFIFAPIPFFKPVTAMVIISAMYFGSGFGFLTGALSALISNFYFGQGPWTPFQMFAWGLIGFLAGLLSDPLKRSKLVLILYAVFSGFLYSVILDTWTTLWADSGFNLTRFLALTATSFPITVVYIVSNVVFLLIFTPLFSKKLDRIIKKYG
ncbi:MAG: ECF transporter S component [Ruminococcus sp.]|nr:ECF transporter S component [Ruminococcus sp.]